ncbi:MAG: cation transporter [Armatimonadetes bacterium]|nr:cation transporter [Armatimonadota bacterium]
MSSEHTHSHTAGASERALRIALAVTATYLAVEIAAGIFTGSLALLSDAAHMFTDASALVIAIVALRLARRPADSHRTYGYYRFEILAAAVNAAVLIVVGFLILVEAYRRLHSPAELKSGWMLGVAVVGLIANFTSWRVLQSGASDSLNLKAAYLEVLSDMLGSLAVILGAVVIRLTGWWQTDPVLAVLIGLWVLPRAWSLLSESVSILLESVPHGLSLDEIQRALEQSPGVSAVHDLHVWSISSGLDSLTAHVVIDENVTDARHLPTALSRMLEERFGITHSTVQIESHACSAETGCALATVGVQRRA